MKRIIFYSLTLIICLIAVPCGAAIDLSIQNVVKLTWNSEPGKTYMVESSNDAENWNFQAQVPSEGDTTSWFESIEGLNKKFYRVREKVKLVCFSDGGFGANLFCVYSDGTDSRHFKSSDGRVGWFSISKDENLIIYTQESAPDSVQYDIVVYNVSENDTTVLRNSEAYKVAYFDSTDSKFYFYITRTGEFYRSHFDGSETLIIADSYYYVVWAFHVSDNTKIVARMLNKSTDKIRFVLYDSSGSFIREIEPDHDSDWWNYNLDTAGERMNYSYIDPNTSNKHVKIYHLDVDVSYNLDVIANDWPTGSGYPLFWSPYNNFLGLQQSWNVKFYSPIDGSVTGQYIAPVGYIWFGADKDWYTYSVNPNTWDVDLVFE